MPDPAATTNCRFRTLRLIAVAMVIGAVAGCVQLSNGTATPDRSGGVIEPSDSVGESSPPPSTGPTPLPSIIPPITNITGITQICEDWGDAAPPSLIDCGDAVVLTLAAIGVQGASSVTRIDVGYGTWCPDSPKCLDRAPDLAWAVARSRAAGSLLIVLARGPDGGLLAWPPQVGPTAVTPQFDPPHVIRPDFGPDTPSKIRDREPFPLCGDEITGPGGPYETSGRQCFLQGVLAGRPVEFVSRTSGTEGAPMLFVYRFTGEGAVVRYVRDGGEWSGSACGVAPLATDAVFNTAGVCDRFEIAN